MQLSRTPDLLAHLQTYTTGQQFTAREVQEHVPQATPGSVSGFLFTCAKRGMLKRSGFKTGARGMPVMVYEMVDPIIEVPVKAVTRSADTGAHLTNTTRTGPKLPRLDGEGPGDAPATLVEDWTAPVKKSHKRKPEPAITPQSVAEELLTLATKVERMQTSLQNVPLLALLKEIERRYGAGAFVDIGTEIERKTEIARDK